MIETERLVLRDWRDEDVDDFLRVCSDPETMEFLGPVMDRGQTAALIEVLQERSRQTGHTFWAMERKEDARVIGFTGVIRAHAPEIEGELEVGWRVARDCWRKGYAHEAAAATLEWIAANRPGERVVAITAVTNQRSRALMEKLGMTYQDGCDFDHYRVPVESPLRRHVIYALDAAR
ncbi:Acetyltransferase (GNAT) family protein [Tsuneonella dongtanensis]|uniref:Acetyltransferase (GNAT) family protein n=1 Tax=Tsuneonella dongtanensis TaxID=692370 RepID=A0A1B2A9Z8_9SPHN|nr:GNAT family N-acetyltransferase [Tsuneonella dongtanensis]ANY18987.1 Acetyltransferase (GNAT) family protein [Tsuneonella dongtanensis]